MKFLVKADRFDEVFKAPLGLGIFKMRPRLNNQTGFVQTGPTLGVMPEKMFRGDPAGSA